MQTEEERKIHPPGHENHGVHVCKKCGWSFPNPHPSAKQRRAHKKVCGKMEGFKVISSESKSNLGVSDDELSDEDPKPEGLKNQHTGLDEKSSGRIEAKVGVNQSVEDVFSDAVSEFPDLGSGPMTETVVDGGTTKQDKDLQQVLEDQTKNCALEAPAESNTPKPTDLICGDQIQVPDALKSEAVQMQSVFHDHSLCSSTDDVSSILDKRTETIAVDPTKDKNHYDGLLLSGASTVVLETPRDKSVGNTTANTCENVIDSVVVAEGHEKGNRDENLPVTVLPGISISDISQIDSTLDNMDEFAYAEVPSELTNPSAVKMAKNSSEDIVRVHEELDNVLGQQKSHNKLSASTQLGSMDSESQEYLDAFVDAAQASEGNIQNPSDTVEDCLVHVHGHGDENLPKSSMPADVTVGNISDIKSEIDLQEHSTISCQEQEQQTEALGQPKPHKELISSTCSGSTQVEADKVDAAVLEGSVQIDCRQDANVDAAVLEGSVQIDSRQDANVETISEKEIHLIDTEVHPGSMSLKHGESVDTCASTMQVEEGNLQVDVPGSKSMPKDIGLTSSECGADGDHNEERGHYIGLTSSECAAEGLRSEGSDARSEVTNGEPLVTNAFTPNDGVMGSICVNTTVSHSEEKKTAFSYGEHQRQIDLSCEIPPQSLIVAADETTMESRGCDVVNEETHTNIVGEYSEEGATDKNSVSGTKINPESANSEEKKTEFSYGEHQRQEGATDKNSVSGTKINPESANSEEKKTEFSYGEHQRQIDVSREIPPQSLIVAVDETTMESRDCDVVNKETHSNIVGEYSEEGATVKNSVSGTKIIPESASGVSETKLQFHGDIGRDEVKRNLQPTENISEPNSDQSSQEIAFRSCLDPSVMKTEGLAGIEMESRLRKPHLEEPKLNESSEVRFHQFDAQNPTSEDHATSPPDTGCVQSSVTLDNFNAKDFSEGDAADNYSHSLGEEGVDIIEQNVKASVFTVETSADSISQTDSVEGYWGSVSDGTVPSTRDVTDTPPILTTETLPTINVQTSTEAFNANTKKGHTDNTDLFEAPSFMTLVEPRRVDKKQPNSTEIQFLQNPQQPNSPSSQAAWFPSPTNVVNESEGRKKNEEIIAKVVNWSSGKPHTPLKNLLVEANLDMKQQKVLTAPDHTTTTTIHKDQTSQDDGPTVKIAPEFSAAPDIKGVTSKEWNSPARLPVSKTGKRKVKAYWVPFVCCSSVN
ncbi:uncharacterized protein LOC143889780 [Tasmannia lanceolata]|uniref:uncharacterized protein LOC143889780 n=1 Tax=Tasmannia lanceolata TaxID=3420 RepID=UPI0040631279